MARRSQPSGFETRRRSRRRLLQAVYQWQMTADSAEDIIRQFREHQDFEAIDAPYFEQLLKQIIADPPALEESLAPFLDRPLLQVDLMERAILRIAACELQQHPEIPWRVVLDEAIDLAHRFGAEKSHSFINGVLDQAARRWRSTEMSAGHA